MKKGLFAFLATMMLATTCTFASMHPSATTNKQFCIPHYPCVVK